MGDTPTGFNFPSPAALAAAANTRARPLPAPDPGPTPRNYAAPHKQHRDDFAGEKVQPRAMWGLAMAASKAGWRVQVVPRPEYREGDGRGWMLIVSDAQHCIHVEYIRSTDVRFPNRVWRLVNRSLTTRCPHGDRVAIGDLREWLGKHPADCEARGGHEVLADLPYMRRSCRDRHPHPRRWDGPVYGGEVPGEAA